MNEETDVKAPVTRLRRRLSVEQSEDGKLSPALGTPTKKRGGRKVVKPELELIEENVAENNLKKTTKKNIAKEVAESIEDKPVTPSRRSARIKSNTSIVSDTVQNIDSPRAKRAARRTSQVGSDSEMSLTPARQTRRTRKDSTSSIEKQAEAVPVVTKAQIPEVITEEPDNVTKSTNDGSKTSDNENTTPVRKSPRLLKKKSRSSNSTAPDDEIKDNFETNNELLDDTECNKSNTSTALKSTEANTNTPIENETEKTSSKKERLSVTSSNLIMNLEDKPKKINSNINKSLSEAQDINKIKSKRHRTKSWTTITNGSIVNDDFYSDNEITKKKHQEKLEDIIRKKPFNSGSGDSAHNHDSNEEEHNSSQNKITSSGKKKKKDSTPKKIQNESEITNLFQKEPSDNIQTTIVMEDSESNPSQDNLLKDDINEDQCVPVVNHQLENKEHDSPEYTLSTSFNKNKNEFIVSEFVNENNTCEPMDVDETLPDNLSNNLSIKEFKNQKKLSLHNSLETDSSTVIKHSDISNRKSSTSLHSTSQNLEKSNTENKSTLIISELKDLSSSENKSPKISNKEQLSQSVTALNMTHENEKRRKISLNYLTSTPIQQQKNGSDNLNDKTTNNIFDNNISKNKDKMTPKKNVSEVVKRSKQSSEEDSESEEESESDKSENLLDNSADEASDDYESGDSRDEDEKQYEKDNEIVEKGETLTSEEEVSNDSDYEKDSFLVSSDEEDNELLSGSGDDLSMSDNELKMDPKSKKKYNDRKLKEQKQASREMFESRHKINNSKTSKVKESSRERLDSSKSEDAIIGMKKRKRMRLNSTASEINKSNIEDRDCGKNFMDLSGSYNESLLKEKEITATEQTIQNIDDPLALNIKEENTSIKEQNKRNVSIGFVDTEVLKNTPSKANTSSQALKSKDPLEDSNDDDSSSLNTDDENIAQNYDDMLNDLKVKTANHSLNVEKKSKRKSSVPIIDQLNITQTKTLKASNKLSQKENIKLNNSSLNSNEQSKEHNENWSMTNYVNETGDAKQQLHENEDASGVPKNKNVKKSKLLDLSLNLDKKSKNPIDRPLLLDQLNLTQIKKKSKTEINKSEKRKSSKIEENLDHDDSSDSIDLKLLFSEDSINSSDINKENVKKTGNEIEEFIPLKKAEAKTDIRAFENLNNDKTDEPFFIDTTGKHSSADEEAEKHKNTKNGTQEREESSDDDSNEEPLEISYKKEQNDKFVKKHKENIDVDETDNVNETLLKTPKSDKKRKKSLSESLSQIENVSDKSLHEMTMNKDIKRKGSLVSINYSNLEDLFSTENTNQTEHNKSMSNTPKIEKKKRLSQSNVPEIEDNSTGIQHNSSISKTPNYEKKKNKSVSESSGMSQEEITENKLSVEAIDEQIHKKKKTCLSQSTGDDSESKTNKDKTDEVIDKTPASDGENGNNTLSKKRKRSSIVPSFEVTLDDSSKTSAMAANDSITSKKKKRKLSQKSEDNDAKDEETRTNIEHGIEINKSTTSPNQSNESQISDSNNICKESIKSISRVNEVTIHRDDEPVITKSKTGKNKKRKHREDDIDANKALKVRKENSFDHIHITRLPSTILNQLDDKPNKDKIFSKKQKVISTTEFVVEETRKRRNKPSNYLEDSIYINDDESLEEKKKKAIIKKPKVLPFIPTATTSNCGYTSNFKVNVIPQEIKFVAQSNNVNSFKNEYLYGKKIKRLGTYDLYKRNRNIKMSKF